MRPGRHYQRDLLQSAQFRRYAGNEWRLDDYRARSGANACARYQRCSGDARGTFDVTVVQNNASKYEAIDNGATLIPENNTVLDPTYSKPTNLQVTEGTYISSPGNLSIKLVATGRVSLRNIGSVGAVPMRTTSLTGSPHALPKSSSRSSILPRMVNTTFSSMRFRSAARRRTSSAPFIK